MSVRYLTEAPPAVHNAAERLEPAECSSPELRARQNDPCICPCCHGATTMGWLDELGWCFRCATDDANWNDPKQVQWRALQALVAAEPPMDPWVRAFGTNPFGGVR